MLTAYEFQTTLPNIEAEDGSASITNSHIPAVHRAFLAELYHSHIDAGVAGGAMLVFVELCDGLAIERIGLPLGVSLPIQPQLPFNPSYQWMASSFGLFWNVDFSSVAPPTPVP